MFNRQKTMFSKPASEIKALKARRSKKRKARHITMSSSSSEQKVGLDRLNLLELSSAACRMQFQQTREGSFAYLQELALRLDRDVKQASAVADNISKQVRTRASNAEFLMRLTRFVEDGDFDFPWKNELKAQMQLASAEAMSLTRMANHYSALTARINETEIYVRNAVHAFASNISMLAQHSPPAILPPISITLASKAMQEEEADARAPASQRKKRAAEANAV